MSRDQTENDMQGPGAQTCCCHTKMRRRNSLVPLIHKWAVSINQDAENVKITYKKHNLNRGRSMCDEDEYAADEEEGDYRTSNEIQDTKSKSAKRTTNANHELHRRSSLDVDVERAVAMINEHPELDPHVNERCPFGTRRDSLSCDSPQTLKQRHELYEQHRRLHPKQ